MKRSAAVMFLLLLAGGVVVLQTFTHDPREDFVARKGALTSAEYREFGEDFHFTKADLTLRSTSGLRAECGVLMPKAPSARVPAFILLGGKKTGKNAIQYVLEIENAVIVALDYLYDPRPSYTVVEFLSDIPAARRALLDMAPSVMLTVDWLSNLPVVDTSRIVIIGYSFGAPIVPVSMTLDMRIDVAVMVYGGGDLESLIHHNVRRFEGEAFSRLVSLTGGLLLRPVEPLRYVDEISPRPLIMINGTQDEQIPRGNVEALFARANEPKRQVWIESGHVHPSKTDLTRQIIRAMKEELAHLQIVAE